MILLDTNVVSETMKPTPSHQVIAWLDRQAPATLYLSTITVAELQYGIACLPDGRRRDLLQQGVDTLIQLYEGRILSFDLAAARRYADLAAQARQRGLGFPLPDSYIGAIAAVSKFKVATRDEAPYLAAGLSIVNPWNAA
ncbi:type II toxin-antitoxin system VapC family toxin [Pseudomonas oryzihabitans]|uniref:Ribonuclease VapC n=1 Tax=Pseudomonas oryzihabitans TaxID=47885 RepID=A0A2Z5A1P4_9PSED|nr:type II toxin-antitoxin system VapC family toxin [Pseudomonas oryzihabitans]AXA64725.1 VapC toxin family PIN domain ribonuclease [Pseudomonas oryzihabitans]